MKTIFVTIGTTAPYCVMPDPRLYLAVKSSGFNFSDDAIKPYNSFFDLMSDHPDCVYVVSDMDTYLASGKPQNSTNHE